MEPGRALRHDAGSRSQSPFEHNFHYQTLVEVLRRDGGSGPLGLKHPASSGPVPGFAAGAGGIRNRTLQRFAFELQTGGGSGDW